MTRTIILANGVVITQHDNSDRSAWTPIDKRPELDKAAQLADAKIEAYTDWQAEHDAIEDWQRIKGDTAI